MKLYDLPAEAAAIEMLLTESEGEITPELEQRLKEFLEGGAQKLENAACVLKSIQAQADACLSESKRLNARCSSLLNNAERLRTLMLAAVDGAFKGKLKTDLFTIYGQNSAPTATFELAPDADLMRLPDEFVKVEAPRLDTGICWEKWRHHEPLPDSVVVTEQPQKRTLRVR